MHSRKTSFACANFSRPHKKKQNKKGRERKKKKEIAKKHKNNSPPESKKKTYDEIASAACACIKKYVYSCKKKVDANGIWGVSAGASPIIDGIKKRNTKN
jgi:hypothetical protein